jgi:hypothetical protein
MTQKTPQELYERSLISEEQFRKIDAITSGKILSVFYELRTLLYLGVLMFTTGAGVLIYQNIGELGHLISILILTLIMLGCYWYVITRGGDYSNDQVKSPNAYFDYILLLGCLLFVSIQGYIQFQYEAFTEWMEWNTLITALFFFYVAYRYDHLGVLSLAITAFASFWGLSVSPQKWYSSDFFDTSDLHITAIVFATILTLIVLLLDKKSVKRHFTFTYLLFCFIIFFTGAIAGIFINRDYDILYSLIVYAGCVFAWYQAQANKSYLFLIYAFIAGYIVTTYLLSEYIFYDQPWIWYNYFLISCGGVVYLIIKYKKLFKR